MKIGKKAYRIFSRLLAPRKGNSIRPLFRLFQAAVYAVMLVFFVNLLSLGNSSFGEWGDFFGGVLNPILTFIMFMGLLITIVIQQEELKETRVELKRSADALGEQGAGMKRQNFESTFFKMLSIHNDIVNSIDLVNSNNRITSGRDCFNVFYTRFNKEYRKHVEQGKGRYTEQQYIELAYQIFWKNHQTELGHYYRYLYNIVRFVEEEGFEGGPYLRLIRAQISDQELLLLFYNCVTKNGGNFTRLVEKYALLDNMPKIRILNEEHLSLLDSTAYGETKSA